jgi:hypothetical protein
MCATEVAKQCKARVTQEKGNEKKGVSLLSHCGFAELLRDLAEQRCCCHTRVS